MRVEDSVGISKSRKPRDAISWQQNCLLYQALPATSWAQITYFNFVCTICTNKTEIHRVGITEGGDQFDNKISDLLLIEPLMWSLPQQCYFRCSQRRALLRHTSKIYQYMLMNHRYIPIEMMLKFDFTLSLKLPWAHLFSDMQRNVWYEGSNNHCVWATACSSFLLRICAI